jgi:hypothetical protein
METKEREPAVPESRRTEGLACGRSTSSGSLVGCRRRRGRGAAQADGVGEGQRRLTVGKRYREARWCFGAGTGMGEREKLHCRVGKGGSRRRQREVGGKCSGGRQQIEKGDGGTGVSRSRGACTVQRRLGIGGRWAAYCSWNSVFVRGGCSCTVECEGRPGIHD